MGMHAKKIAGLALILSKCVRGCIRVQQADGMSYIALYGFVSMFLHPIEPSRAPTASELRESLMGIARFV